MTSHVAKMMERVIKRYLVSFLEEKGFFDRLTTWIMSRKEHSDATLGSAYDVSRTYGQKRKCEYPLPGPNQGV